VQRLGLCRKGIHRPDVETAQLESIAQDVPNVWHQTLMANDLMENVSFIHQIGQATATGLVLEFRAGAVTLFLENGIDPSSQGREQVVEKIGQNDEPDFIEVMSFRWQLPDTHS
jgi:hypothetical protein